MNHRSRTAILRQLVAACCLTATGVYAAETLIPRSMPGDKGRYYLLESKKTGDIIQALHKRVGVDSVVFTKTETNCKTRQMRELGYGEDSPNNIKASPTKWFELVPGSSKNDLAIFVCKW
jgi:hypothetical protein